MDEIDMAILREMNTNCRASYRALSRKTGLSPNAIKRRLTKLVDDGVISRFAIKLSIAMADAEHFLAFVLTDGTESVPDFASRMGKNPMVYHVSALACVSGGAYLLAGDYSGSSMIAELGAFLRALEQVESVELHTMLTTDLEAGRKTQFSKSQLMVLKCLFQNARMQISDISHMSGLSPRTVRRSLRELADGGGINFSASFDMAAGGFLDVFVRINWNDKMISVDELIQWLWKEYPSRFWAPWSSASEPVMFADFLMKNHQEAEQISNQIREAPFVISTTILLSFSAAKFPYFTELKLKELLDAAGV
ncbi:MAG: winged helix-turn-helix transcriptional regulator [Candidatus Thorarchaeota archaeon]